MNGLSWIVVSGGNTLFSVSACYATASIRAWNHITFRENAVFVGDRVSYDYGNTWNDTSFNVIATNHRIDVGVDVCGNLLVSRIGETAVAIAGMAQVKHAVWNGEMGMCGMGSGLARSVDGFHWTAVTDISNVSVGVNGLVWSGTQWLVSLADGRVCTSVDGKDWGATVAVGGGAVAWNGVYFLCADATATVVASSLDGVVWTSSSFATASGKITDLAWNGAIWVAVTDAGAIWSSHDGTQWTSRVTGASGGCVGVAWCGIRFVVNTGSSVLYVSYDGIVWSMVSTTRTSGTHVVWTQPHKGVSHIQTPTLIGGVGGSGLAMSVEGVSYQTSASLFSGDCNTICWDGAKWIAGGNDANNTMKWSVDGKSWVGLGNAVFNSTCYKIVRGEGGWLALGSGTQNTMAVSVDGIAWEGIGKPVFDASGMDAHWNGSVWVAVGRGSTHTLAWTADITGRTGWSGLGKTVFDVAGTCVTWSFGKWIVGGVGATNTLAWATTPSDTWNGLGVGVMETGVAGLATNGGMVVAVGVGATDSFASTVDGVSWSGRGKVVAHGRAVAWNGLCWVATGDEGTAYSYDGVTWNMSVYGMGGGAIGCNGGVGDVGVVKHNKLVCAAKDKLVVYAPAWSDECLQPNTTISFMLYTA
jgi:hypothetical protein